MQSTTPTFRRRWELAKSPSFAALVTTVPSYSFIYESFQMAMGVKSSKSISNSVVIASRLCSTDGHDIWTSSKTRIDAGVFYRELQGNTVIRATLHGCATVLPCDGHMPTTSG